jgi:C-terminal processing protease CtpA/Prc
MGVGFSFKEITMMHKFIALIASAMFTFVLVPSAQAYKISVKQKPGKLRFGAMDEDSIYARAGLQRNDIIREINSKKVDDTTPITEVENVVRKGGRMTIERAGKAIKMKLKPMKDEPIE